MDNDYDEDSYPGNEGIYFVFFKDGSEKRYKEIDKIEKITEIIKLYIFEANFVPETLGNFLNLEHLTINSDGSELNELPQSLGKLVNLKELNLRFTGNYLPESIGNLVNLENLVIKDNHSLNSLPESIRNLKKLEISNTKITSLPESIGNLVNLKELICDCNKLSGI